MRYFAVGAMALALVAGISGVRAQTDVPSATPDQQASTTDPNAAIISKANADKAVADAQKSAYDAQKAASDSKAAAATAANGTVSGTTYATGAVTVSTGGPQSEAMLLVSRAIDAASYDISTDFQGYLNNHPGKVLVITDPAQVTTIHVEVFDVQIERLVKALTAASAEYGKIQQPAPAKAASAQQQQRASVERSLLAAASGIDAGLSALSKLGSYFMTDYTYGSVTVTGVSQMYAASLIRRLGPASRFFISPDNIRPDRTELVKRLGNLDTVVGAAIADHAAAVVAANDLTTRAASDTKNAAELKAAAAACAASATKLQALIDAANGLMTTVFTSSADKAAPIGQIVQEDNIRAEIDKGALVLLVTGTPTAAYYTEKNLWTIFGGVPIYTMGGTTLTVKLYNPKDGNIFYWGTVAVHGGYHSVRNVEKSMAESKSALTAQPAATGK